VPQVCLQTVNNVNAIERHATYILRGKQEIPTIQSIQQFPLRITQNAKGIVNSLLPCRTSPNVHCTTPFLFGARNIPSSFNVSSPMIHISLCTAMRDDEKKKFNPQITAMIQSEQRGVYS
jgi:hypothetical protein